MKLSFLDELYTTPGPIAGAYLDTSRDIDDPDKAVALRWRHLRDNLAEQGTDDATVEVMAEAVGTDGDVPGRHGRALFAAHGQIVLDEKLPQPPARDTAHLSEIPDAMPLAVQHAPDIPYVVVDLSREGEGVALDVVARLQAGRWPMSRVAREPRLERLTTADQWHEGAARLAQELEDLVHRNGAEVIVLGAAAGQPWERGVLLNRMPHALRERTVMVPRGEGQPTADTGRALLEDEVGDLLTQRLNVRDRMHLDMYQAQRARHPAESEGVAGAVAALQRGQAQALLVNRPAEPTRRLWGGAKPTHIARSADELWVFGAPSVREAPAESALIRAVVGTGAELVVVPREELPLNDGVGVLLRYTTAP
ncbi:hypothetical protein [Streptomyces pristinaespiralis]|uniref:baeRF2 domain-containing protein n=1 Tax=Streptomyces pristinaespiralis TaxID=38300 RepID=UPI0033E7D39B